MTKRKLNETTIEKKKKVSPQIVISDTYQTTKIKIKSGPMSNTRIHEINVV